MKLTDFFNTDYVDHASYDNLRKIASVVDGQKNAARKVLYTIMNKNIHEEIKVSQLDSKAAEFAEYLHGSMASVIVNLAQDHIGTNNIALLQSSGNFGTRFCPEASAPRYIYTYGSDRFFELFDKNDNVNLTAQTFEENNIEPVFYVPNLPLLLVNGSDGLSSGFAQKILPRSVDSITQYIVDFINKKPADVSLLIPHYDGFMGTIVQGKTSKQWEMSGVAKKIGVNKVEISELPIGYDLRSYLKTLDTLEDKKVIHSYDDKSDQDKFSFIVRINSKDLSKWSHDDIITKLKLRKVVSENYTVIDENNKICVYETIKDVIDHYIRIKMEYMDKRKTSLLSEYSYQIDLAMSKTIFIQSILDDVLRINKRKKKDIVEDLSDIDGIIKVDGDYDYLLNMSIQSLTVERVNVLTKNTNEQKRTKKRLEKTTIEQLWLNDIT